MPSKCPCGQKYLSRFVVMRHNNVRDFEANLLNTIQNDVEIEPALQKIGNERIGGRTEDEVRPNIRARVVWRQGQNAFLDIQLTNVNANSKKIELLRRYSKSTKKKRKVLLIFAL